MKIASGEELRTGTFGRRTIFICLSLSREPALGARFISSAADGSGLRQLPANGGCARDFGMERRPEIRLHELFMRAEIHPERLEMERGRLESGEVSGRLL